MTSGRAPARPAATAMSASRWNNANPNARRSLSTRPASRYMRYSMRRRRSSSSGSISTPSPFVTTVGAGARGSSARDLIRISCEHTVTNELSSGSRPRLDAGDRVQVGAAQVAQADRQHVELALLDECQQQRDRPVEVSHLRGERAWRPRVAAPRRSGSRRRRRSCASACLVGQLQRHAEIRVGRIVLVPDQVGRPRGASGRQRHLGRLVRVRSDRREGGPEAWGVIRTQRSIAPP